MRPLLLLLFSLATAPLLADRKPLPPLGKAGVWTLSSVATDGTNFLGVSLGTGTPAATLFDGAGRVLRGPDLLPFDTHIHGVGFAGGRYVIFGTNSFLRLEQDGRRVDREPLALPYTLQWNLEIAANGERLLVRDSDGLLFFLDPAGGVTAPPAAVVPSRISSVASDGERFVLVEKDAGTAVRFLILDGAGNFAETIERPVSKPIARPQLATDGATWGLFDPAAAPHLVLLDLDFNTIGSRWTAGTLILESIVGMRGRGYFAVAIRAAGTWDQKWVATELAAPSYEARPVAEGTWGSFRGAADNGTSLFLDHSDPGTQTAGIFVAPSLAHWQTVPRAALPVRALDRYTTGLATNDAGLSLVAWRGWHPWGSFISFIGPDGMALDLEPFALDVTNCNDATSVASDGRGFMVAFRTCDGQIAVAAFDEHGAPARPLRLLDNQTFEDVHVVSDGRNYAVIWDGFDYAQQLPAVAGALLDSQGFVLFRGLIWSGANYGRIAPAPDGSGYLLVMRTPAYETVRSTLLLDATLAPRRGARPFWMHVAPGGWSESANPALSTAPNGYLYATTVVNGTSGERHSAAVRLDADGRVSRSGLGAGRARFDRTPLLTCEEECTIVTQQELSGRVQEILQTSVSDAEWSQFLHGPRTLAHVTGPGRDTARAVGLIPAGLLVERVDPTTGSLDLFLRTPSRVRSVRH